MGGYVKNIFYAVKKIFNAGSIKKIWSLVIHE